jgi:hypothetical protein
MYSEYVLLPYLVQRTRHYVAVGLFIMKWTVSGGWKRGRFFTNNNSEQGRKKRSADYCDIRCVFFTEQKPSRSKRVLVWSSEVALKPVQVRHNLRLVAATSLLTIVSRQDDVLKQEEVYYYSYYYILAHILHFDSDS